MTYINYPTSFRANLILLCVYGFIKNISTFFLCFLSLIFFYCTFYLFFTGSVFSTIKFSIASRVKDYTPFNSSK